MSKLFCLNFMQPLNAVLSGGRSVIVTWLSERNPGWRLWQWVPPC